MSDEIAPKTEIPRPWDSPVPVSHRTCPTHPSTGQRNQFQFRGALQARSAAQIGQKSQSVDRSQGRIRVAHWKSGGP